MRAPLFMTLLLLSGPGIALAQEGASNMTPRVDMAETSAAPQTTQTASITPAIPVVESKLAHQDIQSAYKKGDYEAVIKIAEASNTAYDLAFASHAVISQIISYEYKSPTEASIARAQALAEAALAIDPDQPLARLHLATVMSLKARPMSVRQANASGYGLGARDLTRAILADDPKAYFAHSLLAVWHVETRRRAGGIAASVVGAGIDKGRESYQQALKYGATDTSLIAWQWARALSAYNPKKYRKEILETLELSLNTPPKDAFSEVIQTRSLKLKTYIDKTDYDSGQDYAIMML